MHGYYPILVTLPDKSQRIINQCLVEGIALENSQTVLYLASGDSIEIVSPNYDAWLNDIHRRGD